MGKRFVMERSHLEDVSVQRATSRLNEAGDEPHAMRPYGLASGKFSYRQMFEKKHQSRQGGRAEKRAVKKTARQQTRRELWEAQYRDEED